MLAFGLFSYYFHVLYYTIAIVICYKVLEVILFYF